MLTSQSSEADERAAEHRGRARRAANGWLLARAPFLLQCLEVIGPRRTVSEAQNMRSPLAGALSQMQTSYLLGEESEANNELPEEVDEVNGAMHVLAAAL